MWLAASPTEAGIGSAAPPNSLGWNRPSAHHAGQESLPGIRESPKKRDCTPTFTCHAESAGG